MRSPRFEIVRTDVGWIARFIGSNGAQIWRTSESYTRRRVAAHAVDLVVDAIVAATRGAVTLELRAVDERTDQPNAQPDNTAGETA